MKHLYLSFLLTIICCTTFSQPTRTWGTYYGGPTNDAANAVKTDASGNIYIVGGANSTTAISTVGSHQPIYGGGSRDAFLVKLNSAGVLQWGTYYGGTTLDIATSLALDASGNIYVTGYTVSSTAISTSGSHQPNIGGIQDAFLVKFNNAGVRQWATYYGGPGIEYANSVVIDTSGNVLISGQTGSSSSITTVGSHQAAYGGGSNDAFLAKFDSLGVRQWGTYYGGTGNDVGNSISVDSVTGNIVLLGYTDSPNAISTVGSHQSIFGGTTDAFLVQFNPAGVRQWATYYGGTLDDSGQSVSVDGSGNIYFFGRAASANAISTVGSYQQTHAGGVNDAYLVKFNNAGTIQWGTYFGDAGEDVAQALTLDSNGNIYITGWTDSQNSISTPGSHQQLYGGGTADVFLVQFDNLGMRQWGTYYGGPGNDYGWGVAVNANGKIHLAGYSISSTGISTVGSHQSMIGGAYDSFLAQFLGCGTLSPPSSISGPVSVCDGSNITYSIPPVTGATSYTWALPSGWIGTSTTSSINVNANINSGNVTVAANNLCDTSSMQVISVVVNGLPSVIVTATDLITCVQSTTNLLTGTPFGGTFSGIGVIGNNFDASSAGSGSFYVVYTYTDGNGCTNADSIQITVGLCTSISDVESEKYISIFPNPSSGRFIIDSEITKGEIEIYNSLGEKIYSAEIISNKTEVDLSAKAKGIYFIKVQSEENFSSHKIIIK